MGCLPRKQHLQLLWQLSSPLSDVASLPLPEQYIRTNVEKYGIESINSPVSFALQPQPRSDPYTGSCWECQDLLGSLRTKNRRNEELEVQEKNVGTHLSSIE